LVSDRVFSFLAAQVTVTGACGKANWSRLTQRSPCPCRVPTALNRRPAAERMCPVRLP
jgi:hypothetical protein